MVFPAPAVFSTSRRVPESMLLRAATIAFPILFAESERSLAPAEPG
jgi:formate dehydrogenase assembly factor FdhD